MSQSLSQSNLMLPQVYIAGFRKCGTTTLCNWLSQHPKMAQPTPKEPNVLAFDDIRTNEFTFFEAPNRWFEANYQENFEEEIQRYNTIFQGAKEGQLRFDGTPNYVLSRKAMQRIKDITPNAKLIFVLRHPTKRALSDHAFALKQRRAMFSLEKHLRYETLKPLLESCYLEYLSPWYDAFPSEQILTITLEQMVSEPQKVFDSITQFLEITPFTPNFEQKNKGKSFFSNQLQYVLNRIPKYWNAKYHTIEHWPRKAVEKPDGLLKKYATKTIRRLGSLNMTSKQNKPKIKDSFRERLDEFFTRENKGLSHLTGINLKSLWGMDV